MIFFRSIGTKKSNAQWIDPAGDRPTIQRRLLGEKKRLISVAVTFTGKFHLEILNEREMMNGERYKQFLINTEHNFRRHSVPVKWNTMMLMHDNARPHRSRCVENFLESKGVELVRQPPLSPDFNLLDRFVFSSIENARCGTDFDSEEELKSFLTSHLRLLGRETYMKEFSKFKNDLCLVIEKGGQYL